MPVDALDKDFNVLGARCPALQPKAAELIPEASEAAFIYLGQEDSFPPNQIMPDN